MAYDPGNHLVYCASKLAGISVVRVGAGKLTSLGSVADEKTTHSVAVDPKSHTMWIAYSKGGECFVQPFTTRFLTFDRGASHQSAARHHPEVKLCILRAFGLPQPTSRANSRGGMTGSLAG
ncbi:MAG: hypothetical protein ACRD10_02615 [Terriglobia bacterium]